MSFQSILKLTASAAVILFAVENAEAAEVEVLHWWTSGGEAAALDVLKKNLEAQGVTWQDMPVAGGRDGGQSADSGAGARLRHHRLGEAGRGRRLDGSRHEGGLGQGRARRSAEVLQ